MEKKCNHINCNSKFETKQYNKLYCSIKCKKAEEYLRNSESYKSRAIKNYFNNHEENKSRNRDYQLKNRDELIIKKKQYYKDNKDSINPKKKEYYKKNKEYFNGLHKIRMRVYRTDTVFRLADICRKRIYDFLRKNNYNKSSSTFEMIGCTPDELREHIENQFTKGMSWELGGEIHIDHKIPLSSASTEEEVVKLCHFSNLQPLWKEDNLKKSDKL